MGYQYYSLRVLTQLRHSETPGKSAGKIKLFELSKGTQKIKNFDYSGRSNVVGSDENYKEPR